MVMAETSTFGIFRGRNVPSETSMAEMSVAEMSYILFPITYVKWSQVWIFK